MSYKFFQNKECEYFPCHEVKDTKDFNCMFCYCPLYPLKDKCGGNFSYTPNGIKDCSGCTFPHRANNYELVLEKLMDLM